MKFKLLNILTIIAKLVFKIKLIYDFVADLHYEREKILNLNRVGQILIFSVALKHNVIRKKN